MTESAASADENTKRMFTCDCCESCDLATETYDGNLPARYMDRFKKFWSDEREQANHPVIAFEYRSECAKYRTAMAHRDDPAHSWYTQDMPVLLKHLASRHPNDGPIPEDWETDTLDGESKGPGGQKGGNVPLEFRSVGVEGSRWGHCARFAMTTPSPTTQIASLPTLRKLTALGEHRPLVGFHARTLAVDVPACMPPTTEVSWKAVDDAFSRLSVGGASPETCRQTPYTCRGGLMFWPDVFGSLSGFFDCAKRVASLGLPLTSLETSGSFTSIRTRTGDVDVNEPARVFATTDSAVVHELLEHDDDVVVFGNASSLVVPTWNGFSSVTAEKLSNVGPSGRGLRRRVRESIRLCRGTNDRRGHETRQLAQSRGGLLSALPHGRHSRPDAKLLRRRRRPKRLSVQSRLGSAPGLLRPHNAPGARTE